MGNDAKQNDDSSPAVPDPDPLLVFDLETATARNFVYANKTMRYPYHQASDICTGIVYRLMFVSWCRRWRISPCISTIGSRSTRSTSGTLTRKHGLSLNKVSETIVYHYYG